MFEVGRNGTYADNIECNINLMCDDGDNLRWRFTEGFDIEFDDACQFDHLDIDLAGLYFFYR